jgi:signal transduction histidine kinase
MIKTMKERILLVENDPEISDLINRQTLQPLGYQVEVVGAAPTAIQEAIRFVPDVILADLNLPGLSGKDLLVALTSQGVEIPIIVIAPKGMESDVIQAFRLGAVDFLSWPIREAEVVSAVERVLRQGRARREREQLARQLNLTNQELQRRVRELTTIFAIGKAVISITDQQALFDKILEGAVFVTEADSGWLLSRDERSKSFLLRVCRNVPAEIQAKINQVYDDGISSLVALSGEPLSIHGDPLKRFKVAQIGQAALVVPIKVKKEVVGLLVVARKASIPFTTSQQALLEAVADYASISLVNARLFRALEERLSNLQQTTDTTLFDERIQNEILRGYNRELLNSLEIIQSQLGHLTGKEQGKLSPVQIHAVQTIQSKLGVAQSIAETMSALPPAEPNRKRTPVNLNELVQQAINLFKPLAQQGGITIQANLPGNAIYANIDSYLIAYAIDGLLSNALKYTRAAGQVILKLELKDNQAHLSVSDNGPGIHPQQLSHIFEAGKKVSATLPARYGGVGIRLPLIKEIVAFHNGNIWAENVPGGGCAIHITLPGISL